jgi:hypothetical protein
MGYDLAAVWICKTSPFCGFQPHRWELFHPTACPISLWPAMFLPASSGPARSRVYGTSISSAGY